MNRKFEEIYQLTETKPLKEQSAVGCVYEHRKTGAKIMTISCEDPNKVMFVGFRTPSEDSRGTAHIIEHSVLCGSERFPAKDLMVELAKGSMHTFLNALTFPDKTIYPIASMNDKDFMNLTEVYLDAVFHPMVMKDSRIFRQEGWHIETDDRGELHFNGVVFNEMKGVFSNPDSVLSRTMLHTLYPHTGYAFDSGGDPMEIPKLSYEDFKEYYRRYYHPSNSYLYLYGDMDMEEKLLWIDEICLSKYDRLIVDSEIREEMPLPKPASARAYYSVTENEGTEEKTQIAVAYSIPAEMDGMTELAIEILQFYLIDTPGAPLRERLLERDLGEDIDGAFEREIRQPYFYLKLSNTQKEALPDFCEAIREILIDITEKGLDETSLRAAINYIEFKYREADFGSFPKGLLYGMSCLGSWLYDAPPFMYLSYDREFASLKEKVGTGYFEDLIKKIFLENGFRAEVTLIPKIGYSEEKETVLNRLLSEKKDSMSLQELERIKTEEKQLKAWQEQEEPEEIKKLIPRLKLSDLSGEPDSVPAVPEDGILMTEIPTSGIAYINLIYDLSAFSGEQLQFVSFLTSLYGDFDTKRHSLKEFTDEMLLKTGGISADLDDLCLNADVVRNTPFMPVLRLEIRCLKGKIADALSLAFEMIEEIDLADEKRLKEKFREALSQLESQMDSSMHQLAIGRILSYMEKANRLNDLTGGIAFYDFLCGAMKMNRDRVHQERFFAEIREVNELVCRQPFEAALTGDKEMLCELTGALGKLKKENFREVKTWAPRAGCETIQAVSKLNEGFKTGSMVNYVATAGYFLAEGERYTGVMDVLKNIISYEYLWPEVRVLGGAYGCILQFTRSGKGVIVSYRDPQLKETLKRYTGIPDWLEALELGREKLEQHIIGTVSGLERPMTPSVKADRAISFFYSGVTPEKEIQRREEVLRTDLTEIREMAEKLRSMLSGDCLCVVGGKEAIETNKDLFRSIRTLKGR